MLPPTGRRRRSLCFVVVVVTEVLGRRLESGEGVILRVRTPVVRIDKDWMNCMSVCAREAVHEVLARNSWPSWQTFEQLRLIRV